MINCIIIDDESYAIETLSDYVAKTSGLRLIAEYSNPMEALAAIKSGEKPDLLFLDVDMPALTGFELAALLPPDIAIIYTTAFANYALKSFETNVYDFLLKPISFSKFLKSIDKVMNIMANHRPAPSLRQSDFFFINPGIKGKVIKIALTDIIYVEGLKNYVIIYLKGGKHITYLTMQEVEEALPADRFLRVHKSYIINLSKLQSIEGNTIHMADNLTFPLGGSYKNALINFVNSNSIITKRKG